MENEVVRRRPWLTHAKFLDLIGMLNLIPGPSSTELALFIGYRRAGGRGLGLGGVGFILPAALLAVVTWQLGRAALVDGLTVVLAVPAGVLLLRHKVNSAWLVLADGLIGWIFLLNNY